jgi:hypothetical protein
MIRAILLASATTTSMRRLRASAGAPLRTAQRTTALAPMIGVACNRHFDSSSLCLPLVDRCTAVSPSQAAVGKRLPLLSRFEN